MPPLLKLYSPDTKSKISHKLLCHKVLNFWEIFLILPSYKLYSPVTKSKILPEKFLLLKISTLYQENIIWQKVAREIFLKFENGKILTKNSTLYQENIIWQEVAREIFSGILPILRNDVKFLVFLKFLELTSNSWNF